mmetsp:Transcript_11816/g.17612  ORF Transcript_11816/g.17612 Transcript_11816/m.17612 type:complete len:552 (-) Transcript_11816:102-1757(-)
MATVKILSRKRAWSQCSTDYDFSDSGRNGNSEESSEQMFFQFKKEKISPNVIDSSLSTEDDGISNENSIESSSVLNYDDSDDENSFNGFFNDDSNEFTASVHSQFSNGSTTVLEDLPHLLDLNEDPIKIKENTAVLSNVENDDVSSVNDDDCESINSVDSYGDISDSESIPMDLILEALNTPIEDEKIEAENCMTSIHKINKVDLLESFKFWRNKLMPQLANFRPKLKYVNRIDDVATLIERCSNIVVLTGAGISVSCGIPDFRSENGIYNMLGEYNLPDPQSMFELEFFKSNPIPFFQFAKHLLPGNYKPSATHNFLKLLDSKGKLLRNYTQNIDGLEREAKIDMCRVHQCHGSLDFARCLFCHNEVPLSSIRQHILEQRIPMCQKCKNPRGILKPNIVFFGESLGSKFGDLILNDRNKCDLVIVMGSSLKVAPVSEIIGWMPKNIPLVLFNREVVGQPHSFDVELLGDCDSIVSHLCHKMNWPLEGGKVDEIPPEFEAPSTYYFANCKRKEKLTNKFSSPFYDKETSIQIYERHFQMILNKANESCQRK